MEIKLKKRSWHSIMYKIFYRSDVPQSLCPYFWKGIIAIVFFVPMVIWALPEIIVETIKHKRDDYDSEEYLEDQFSGEFGAMRFFVNLVAWAILACLGATFIWTYPFFADGIVNGWLLGWPVIFGVIIWILIESDVIPAKEWRDNYRFNRRSRKMNDSTESTPVGKVAKEWVKGIYKKYCPKITWID